MTRLEKLHEKLSEFSLENFIFANRNNIYYFSGYAGEGLLAVKGNKRVIITDFRYTEQARQEAPDCEVVELADMTYAAAVNEVFKGAKKVGFEQDELTVSQLEAYKKEAKRLKFVPTIGIGIGIRAIKDDNEIALLQNAMDATQDALYKAYELAKVGMREIELCADLEYYLKKKYGASPSFDFIIASGENGSMPHAVTGERRLLQGDMVTLDFGAKIARYNADMTRTFAMGKPGEKLYDIYKIVQEAQNTAQAMLAPGVACFDVDKAARDIIVKHGYGQYFGHGTGHGVGLNIHEEPRLSTRSKAVLEKGMAVTVEPGIYIPGLGGVRIENSCYITDSGYKSFFDASTDLNIIDGGKK